MKVIIRTSIYVNNDDVMVLVLASGIMYKSYDAFHTKKP